MWFHRRKNKPWNSISRYLNGINKNLWKKEIKLERERWNGECGLGFTVTDFFVNRSRHIGDTAGSSNNNELFLDRSARFGRWGFWNGGRWFVKRLRELGKTQSFHSLLILFHSLAATLFVWWCFCHHFDFEFLARCSLCSNQNGVVLLVDRCVSHSTHHYI